jgi:hypothetical protein
VSFKKPAHKVSWEQFKLLNESKNNWFKNNEINENKL